MLVDSHCHLDLVEGACECSVQWLLDRALIQGVSYLQTICLCMEDFPKILAIANSHKNVFCSVGVHPCYVHKYPLVSVEDLLEATREKKVIGIGESGMDFFHHTSYKKQQELSFRTHIAAARKSGLPVIIHTRNADEATLDIMEDEYEKGSFPSLIHCFSASVALARKALEMGSYISVSGIITFPKAQSVRDSLKDIPLNRLLVETDSPYLAPVPYRGKICEPSYVVHTAQYLATIKNVDFQTLATTTTENFFSLFKKAQR